MRYRDFKHYYIFHVCENMNKDFPGLVSSDRLAELMQKSLLTFAVYAKTRCMGKCTGITYVDSSHIKACDIKRAHYHKVLKDQCSTGWFFGLKLHFVVNDKGEILDFVLTPCNVNDQHLILGNNLLKKIHGKFFGDKRYISQSLFEKLFIAGINFITKLTKNMKNSLMAHSL